MALNFTLQKEKIEFAGGDIEVRGLTFPDISKLIMVHRDSIVPLFDKYAGRSTEKMIIDDVGEITLDLLMSAPTMITHVIAMAADSEDQFNLVAAIPIGAQCDIIAKVAELTFKTNGGLGNLVAVVKNQVRSTAAALKLRP